MSMQPLEPSLKVTWLRTTDEVRLPATGRAVPIFQPRATALDEILRPFSLDDRVKDMLRPPHITPVLMEPTEMSQAREEARKTFEARAGQEADGELRRKLLSAAKVVAAELVLADEMHAALAALLKG